MVVPTPMATPRTAPTSGLRQRASAQEEFVRARIETAARRRLEKVGDVVTGAEGAAGRRR